MHVTQSNKHLVLFDNVPHITVNGCVFSKENDSENTKLVHSFSDRRAGPFSF